MSNNYIDLLKIAIKRIESELLQFSIIVIIFIIFFNQFRFWIIGIYILGMISFVVFELAKLKGVPEKLETPKKPEIVVYACQKEKYFLLEFCNIGNEAIVNLESKIFWQQKEGRQERALKFIDENEKPLWAYPRDCKIIRKDEKKYATNIPTFSLDGKILVRVSGNGAESKKKFNKNFEIKNKIRKE